MNHILFLVDDDADDRFMFEEALQHVAPHCTCYMSENGHDAIAMLNSGKVKIPQVILLDVNMPVIDGWQCLKFLKSDPRFRNIPVIMYSTSSYQEDIEKALDMGALCFFTKPNDFEELEKMIKLIFTHLNTNSLKTLSEVSELFNGR